MSHRVINLPEENNLRAFAQNAAECFKAKPWVNTYSENERGQETDIQAGDYLAIRWNICTVMVLKVDESMHPRLYPTLYMIGGDLPVAETKQGA